MLRKHLMLIGVNTQEELGTIGDCIVNIQYDHDLHFIELAAQDFVMRNYVIFDMATAPERGDALDNLDMAYMVIAYHLYYDDFDRRRFFYNRNNNDLLPLCRERNIPLLCLGDSGLRWPTPDFRGVWWKLWRNGRR